MDSWSYGTSAFLANANGSSLLPFAGFEQGLSTELDVNGFNAVSITKVASSDDDENQSSSSKLSRVDFKLRDYGNYDGGTSSRAKRPRAASSYPLCQVYGCNMDLSFSKDYHKRHRVCEAHSKTSVVIVSGIQQRFCQQCSRFHFLSEFDDGKRSCRRRLAGHNERRRKPSFCFLPGKRHRSSQESFPGSFLYRVMDEQDHHRASGLVSFKDEPMCPAQNRIYESKPAIYSPDVSSIWDLHEAAPHSTCAHSLLSAQSQQHLSQITQSNPTLNHSTLQYQTDLVKNKTGSSSCTVDLLQLSSHLQRVEQQQRNFTNDVKQEYNNELYFPNS